MRRWPTYAAEAFHLLGLGFTAAVKATWALGFIVGALGMYRLARRWWGDAAGLIASLAYTYAPYHLVDIYVRAALAEFTSLAIFPWVLLAFDRVWDRPGPRRAAVAALALAALLLTHTIAPVTFLPLLAAFLAAKLIAAYLAAPSSRADGDEDVTQASGLLSPRQAQAGGLRYRRVFRAVALTRPLLWAGVALILGLGLAAIYLVPLFLERGYTGEAVWLRNTYSYSLHFVYPSQFLDPRWGFGYSVEGPGDGMSFQLGLLPFLGAAIGATLTLRRGAVRSRAIPLFLVIASLAAIFLMTPASRPIWDHAPLIGLIQFPWRLLAVTTVTLALLCGAGVRDRGLTGGQGRESAADVSSVTGHSSLVTRYPPFVFVAAIAIVLASFPYTRPQLQPIRPEDESPIAIMEFELRHPDMRGMTRWMERQPADADSPLLPQYLAGQTLTRAAIVVGDAVIVEQRHTANTAYARVVAKGEARLRFYTSYFPGWQATVDGQAAEIAADPPNGLIGLTLSPGEHQVRLRFGATTVRRVAALVSAAMLAAVLALLFVGRRFPVLKSGRI